MRLTHFPCSPLQKLLLWATLVFLRRGSQLQMGGATLLTVIRLVLHAHYEPFRDPMDNLFDYKTYIGTSLISFGGMILLSLEVSKEFAMSKKDEVGIQFAEEAIVVVSTILDVAAWMVVVVFALFFINLVISQNKTASALVTRIDGYFRRCCHRCCRCRRRRPLELRLGRAPSSPAAGPR